MSKYQKKSAVLNAVTVGVLKKLLILCALVSLPIIGYYLGQLEVKKIESPSVVTQVTVTPTPKASNFTFSKEFTNFNSPNYYVHTNPKRGYGFRIEKSPGLIIQTEDDPKSYNLHPDEEKLVFKLEMTQSEPIDYYSNLYHVRIGIVEKDAMDAFRLFWDKSFRTPLESEIVTVDGIEGKKYLNYDGEGGIFPVTTVMVTKGNYTYFITATTNTEDDPRFVKLLSSFKFAFE